LELNVVNGVKNLINLVLNL